MTKSQTLLEVFDHLFDLPAFRIVLDHLDSRQMGIRTDQIADVSSFLFDDDHSHLTNSLDGGDELGNFEGFILAIQTQRHLPIG